MVRPSERSARAAAGSFRSSRAAAIASLWLLGWSLGCGPSKPVLHDLRNVEQLKAQFNRDAGKARVVLLLSPT
jgi:hypothetical protein